MRAVLAAVSSTLIAGVVSAAVLVATEDAHEGSGGSFRGVVVAGQAVTKDELARLLDERAAAVMRGDEEAFMTTVDGSNRANVRGQRRLFRNLETLPLARYSLNSYQPILPRNPYGTWIDGDMYLYETMQIEGVDKQPSNVVFNADLTVFEGRLCLRPSQRQAPWAATPLVVATRPHVVVALTKSDAEHLNKVADAAERAARRTAQYWAPSWQQEFVVFATSDHRLFDKVWFGGGLGADFEGYATQVPRLDAQTQGLDEKKGESRVVLDLGRTTLSRARLGQALRHEFTHAATANSTRPRTPLWVIEGYAEQTGQHEAQLPSGGPYFFNLSLPGGLNSGATWRAFYRGDVGRHYAMSYLAFRYIYERYGDARSRDFYLAAQGGGAATRKAWRTLRTSRAEFVAAWNRWGRANNLVL